MLKHIDININVFDINVDVHIAVDYSTARVRWPVRPIICVYHVGQFCSFCPFWSTGFEFGPNNNSHTLNIKHRIAITISLCRY